MINEIAAGASRNLTDDELDGFRGGMAVLGAASKVSRRKEAAPEPRYSFRQSIVHTIAGRSGGTCGPNGCSM